MNRIIIENEKLRDVQLKQLEIFLHIKNICEEHNIKYFMLGGTLLGAERHKGFIPWDDDLDIGMLRVDYEKFIEVCERKLSDLYFLQTTLIENQYSSPFLKIRANNTIFEEEHVQHLNMHKGVWVDVFPLDYVKKKESVFLKYRAFLIGMFTSIISYKNNSVKLTKRRTKVLFSLLSCLSVNKLDKIRTNLMIGNCSEGSEYVTNFGSNYGYVKQMFKVTDFLPTKMVEFEKEQFPVPNENIKVLERIFGDYMRLPEPNKRHSGHIISKYKI